MVEQMLVSKERYEQLEELLKLVNKYRRTSYLSYRKLMFDLGKELE